MEFKDYLEKLNRFALEKPEVLKYQVVCRKRDGLDWQYINHSESPSVTSVGTYSSIIPVVCIN